MIHIYTTSYNMSPLILLYVICSLLTHLDNVHVYCVSKRTQYQEIYKISMCDCVTRKCITLDDVVNCKHNSIRTSNEDPRSIFMQHFIDVTCFTQAHNL